MVELIYSQSCLKAWKQHYNHFQIKAKIDHSEMKYGGEQLHFHTFVASYVTDISGAENHTSVKEGVTTCPSCDPCLNAKSD